MTNTQNNQTWEERWNKLKVKSFNLKTNKYQDEPICFINDKSWKIVKSFIKSEINRAVEEKNNILELIEEWVGGDLSNDMEYRVVMDRSIDQEEAKQMVDLIGKIYRLTHSYNENNSCYCVHDGWRKEFKLFIKSKKLQFINHSK